jgi:hypothetical protein
LSERSNEPKRVVHLVEKITVQGPGGEEIVRAKVDTGADRTTVDKDLATRLKLGPELSKVRIKASAGSQRVERPVVDALITVAGKAFKLKVGVADRSQMRYSVIIGRDILRSGYFLIDPTKRKKKS